MGAAAEDLHLRHRQSHPLTGGQVAWGTIPPITALALQAGFDGRTIALSSLSGSWQDGAITGTAQVPRALIDQSVRAAGAAAPRGHARLKVTGLTQAAITPFVSAAVLEQIVGQVSATVDADILGTELKDIVGTLVLLCWIPLRQRKRPSPPARGRPRPRPIRKERPRPWQR